MKEFTTAAKAAADDPDAAEAEVIRFKVDGRDIEMLPPSEGQVAILLAGASDLSSTPETVASAINFFMSLLRNREDITYFKRRLLSHDDNFGADQVAEIVQWLVEEWTARPTKQPSDYMPSQQSGGARSTGQRRHRASTHSSSGQTVSAT